LSILAGSQPAGTNAIEMHKPKVIHADRGYDSDSHRRRLRERGIRPVIARRRTEHGSGLGKFRWVAERTLSSGGRSAILTLIAIFRRMSVHLPQCFR
jgi:transposase